MQHRSSRRWKPQLRFCIAAILMAAGTHIGVCQENALIDPKALPGAVVKINEGGPLTLNEGGRVTGAGSYLEKIKGAAAAVPCTVREVESMRWEASTTQLMLTWSFETRCRFFHTTTRCRYKLAPVEKGSDKWSGTFSYTQKTVQNGRTLSDPNAIFRDSITATVKYKADNESRQEQVKKFNSEVRETIEQIQKQFGDDIHAAWKYADTTLRDERGHDTVSVAVEHYLFGLVVHDWTGGVFDNTLLPAAGTVAWELLTAASVSVFGDRPGSNPAYVIKLPFAIPNPFGGKPVTEWNLTWGWLNPGDRGNFWDWVAFWGAAGAYGDSIENLSAGRLAR